MDGHDGVALSSGHFLDSSVECLSSASFLCLVMLISCEKLDLFDLMRSNGTHMVLVQCLPVQDKNKYVLTSGRKCEE